MVSRSSETAQLLSTGSASCFCDRPTFGSLWPHSSDRKKRSSALTGAGRDSGAVEKLAKKWLEPLWFLWACVHKTLFVTHICNTLHVRKPVHLVYDQVGELGGWCNDKDWKHTFKRTKLVNLTGSNLSQYNSETPKEIGRQQHLHATRPWRIS